jgi:integrase
MPKLTKKIVEDTQATDKDTWVWDTDLPGFGMRIQPSGRKTYVTRYRTAAGTQRKTTIARCCDLTADKARELARKTFAAVAEGKDPAAEKHAMKTAPTVDELRVRYMREHATPFKKTGSVANDEMLWRLHVIPALGKKRVDAVTRADILALHGSLAEKPATANACVALLSKAFNLSELWGWRTAGNPCRQVKKFKIRERETILTHEQIGRLNDTLNEMTLDDEIPQAMADLIRLLLVTGCRLNEIMSARQEWIDRERQLLLLPDSKVGQRRIALSAAAMEIIEDIPAGEWLIPGRCAGEHLKHPHGMFKQIKARAKLPADLRPHDLRHTAGSLAHMAGLTQKQVATMLGHRQLQTTARYLHGFAGDDARAVDTVGNVISANFRRPPQQIAA